MLLDVESKRVTVLRVIFGERQGYMCLARIFRPDKSFAEAFFEYPAQLNEAMAWVDQYCDDYDVYFCPHLFADAHRVKDAVTVTTCAWADLDECAPSNLLVEPSLVWETSLGRYQAVWMFSDEYIDPADAEDISKRVAYYHKGDGADTSGWDLTQLLRLPYSYNHKKNGLYDILVKSTSKGRTSLDTFRTKYPPIEGANGSPDIPVPQEVKDANTVLEAFRTRLTPRFWELYETVPETDWSKALWHLEMQCFEAGMDMEEAFAVVLQSACNKYNRDGKPSGLLWREVVRSYRSWHERHHLVPKETILQHELLTDEERAAAQSDVTFVEEYVEWAKGLGDAAWQYHQAGAFVVLSSLLAGPVRLPTSFGTMLPNLWFMIMADTTLTRKSTAMDLAMDMLVDVDPDVILATDGSIEGLFTALAMRPGRPSVFLRDEFSGLVEMMNKKDYYAGMAETFTKMYDGKLQKRILRKETIEVREPVLIVFGGGIRSRLLQLFTYEHVASGFLPRFLFITANSDVTRLRPLGPPAQQELGRRSQLVERLHTLKDHYSATSNVVVRGPGTPIKVEAPKHFNAELTPEAWARYNEFERVMLEVALKSSKPDLLTPTFDRLAKSGLKASVLIAASRHLGEKVRVTERDLIKAFYYIERWREHTIEVVDNIGRTTTEHQLALLLKHIERKPGITRSEIMQHHHLSAREAQMLFETLDQRGTIVRQAFGRTEKLYPVGVEKV